MDDKSNEIPAERELLGLMELSGATVRLDAMHCQVETAAAIHQAADADYILMVKDNQQSLYQALLDRFIEYGEADYRVDGLRRYVAVEKSHAPVEAGGERTTASPAAAAGDTAAVLQPPAAVPAPEPVNRPYDKKSARRAQRTEGSMFVGGFFGINGMIIATLVFWPGAEGYAAGARPPFLAIVVGYPIGMLSAHDRQHTENLKREMVK